MWDRLLVDCNIATMDPDVPGAFGAIENGAIGIQDGRIVRVGRRTELAGYKAKKVEPLDGAWVTPGLVDCHTHLVFGGNRSAEFEQRLGGASYEEIARSGGGIASTVRATREASLEALIQQSRPRLQALMRGGVTTVEIKSGYGLDIQSELKMLGAARALGQEDPRHERVDPGSVRHDGSDPAPDRASAGIARQRIRTLQHESGAQCPGKERPHLAQEPVRDPGSGRRAAQQPRRELRLGLGPASAPASRRGWLLCSG